MQASQQRTFKFALAIESAAAREALKRIRQDDCEVQLPTERQWERAARGTDGRDYPYEGDFDASKGNTNETGIGQTSAVGIFPQSASPDDVLDMSGNVWEWCLNEYIDSGNTALEGDAVRVWRGGSWSFDGHNARAVDRFRFVPNSRFIDSGFRVAVSVTVQ